MMRQIILDTETTGLDPQGGDRIIEIGCVEVAGRRRTGRVFHRYVNPERAIPEESTAIHGITDADVTECPVFADLAEELFGFVDGAELVIHNAPFDVGFLNMELQKAGWPRLEDHCQILDTLQEARHRHPGQKNDLDSLCGRYEVDNSRRDKHGALLDSEILADVFLAMTGGQEDLALAAEETSPASAAERLLAPEDTSHRPPLAVVEPTSAEWSAHRHFLERIQEESGDCLWLDREESAGR
ncbi:DNA polymerase III subunit epsilon [Thiohalorhabdus methylotrophus]|uniref:DNA polymerase III subunit epsilon n=1 Tax=Thiohalorhabdus methylotrophus TaxID=3242694 RepID=A0ABV4TW55_9GAMM